MSESAKTCPSQQEDRYLANTASRVLNLTNTPRHTNAISVKRTFNKGIRTILVLNLGRTNFGSFHKNCEIDPASQGIRACNSPEYRILSVECGDAVDQSAHRLSADTRNVICTD